MLPDRVSNPGSLTYESGALPIALRGPAGPIVQRGYTNLLMHYLCCGPTRHCKVTEDSETDRWQYQQREKKSILMAVDRADTTVDCLDQQPLLSFGIVD